jgi:hypothetical protein
MNSRFLRGMLRGIAIAIAVAALVDPVLSIERAPAIPLALITMTVSDVAPIEREVRRINSGTEVHLREAVHRRVPCGPGERCVVIADGSVDADVPPDLDQPLSLIRITNSAGANVGLHSVVLATGQHASAASVARVTVDGRDVIGRRTEIKISDNGALVGSGVVEWKADGLQTMDVPWWPLASGPRTLRIEVVPTGDESVLFDNILDAGVDVGADRLPVLVFDARSSWSSTFVRRALEDDSRFVVEHRARLAPAIAAGTANGRLDARALDAASVLIVGGPDALTASEVDLIERFVRVRGGTAVLLPERVPSGSARRLFAGEWTERLTSEPQSVGPLKATEILVYSTEGGHHQDGLVLAATGSGRIVISTEMDAWRYRDDDGGTFDRFWRSVVAEGAAAGAPLRLEFEHAIAFPGGRQPFTMRYMSMTPASNIEANAVARCGPPSQPSVAAFPQAASADRVGQTIRLWPAGAPGVMRGELPIADGTSCTVEATVNDATVTRGIAVSAFAPSGLPPSRSALRRTSRRETSTAMSRPAADTLAKLEQHAFVSGGVVTDADNLNRTLGSLSRRNPERAKADVHPMRAAWWLLPFAGCLSIEWWLRRRVGLR